MPDESNDNEPVAVNGESAREEVPNNFTGFILIFCTFTQLYCIYLEYATSSPVLTSIMQFVVISGAHL